MREKLIEKLRTAKTNEERDQILRDLADQDKTIQGNSQRAEAADVGKPAAAEPEGKTQARLSPTMRDIILPLIGAFGLYLIITEVMKIMEGRQWGFAESKYLVMGCVFLFAAIFFFLKDETARKEAGEEMEGKTQVPPSPVMRTIILLMMVLYGLFFIVTSVMKFMERQKWGGYEITVLIWGCTFLFVATLTFLKKRQDEEKAGR